METETGIERGELTGAIREVFSYINRFQGQTFVLKIEDTLLEHPLFPVLMADIAQLSKSGVRTILVPGARRSIDTVLEAYGQPTVFHEGVRLTSREAMPMVEQAALGVAHKVLAHLTAHGCNGMMGNWVQARSIGIVDGVDYQMTGRIERVQKEILQHLLGEGFIPILPPIGWNKLGHAYNISSNELATALCEHMRVVKLFFIGMEQGIRAEGLTSSARLEVTDNGVISALDPVQARDLLESNLDKLAYSQRDYLSNAVAACASGVNRVHLISGLSQGSILQEVFSSRGEGTMVYANQYRFVRSATIDDIPEILRIMQDWILRGFLIPRSQEDILEKLSDYLVYEVDNTVQGCGALHDWGEGWGEIAAIATGSAYRKGGVGETIVNSLLRDAERRRISHVFLLTTQAADWFYGLGFRDGSVDDLPSTKRAKYDTKRGSRVLVREV